MIFAPAPAGHFEPHKGEPRQQQYCKEGTKSWTQRQPSLTNTARKNERKGTQRNTIAAILFHFCFIPSHMHCLVAPCCELIYSLSIAAEGNGGTSSQKKEHAVFILTGLKSGKTRHTLKCEIWQFIVQLDKRCNNTVGFAFDKLQTTMVPGMNGYHINRFKKVLRCWLAALVGMVQQR